MLADYETCATIWSIHARYYRMRIFEVHGRCIQPFLRLRILGVSCNKNGNFGHGHKKVSARAAACTLSAKEIQVVALPIWGPFENNNLRILHELLLVCKQ
jgi:hypothetical protein